MYLSSNTHKMSTKNATVIFDEIDSLKSEIEDLRGGCGDLHDEDDEDSDTCSYGDLCDWCSNMAVSTEEALVRAKEELNELFDVVCDAFVVRAEKLGFDGFEALQALGGNWRHGAYCQDHGGCATNIVLSYDIATKTIDLHDEQIIDILHAMDCAQGRHNDTNYDELRAKGVSRETARTLIA